MFLVPMMQFAEAKYDVDENDASVIALIQRSGDLSKTSTVRCYTRQNTAHVSDDYAERPNTNASIVTFESGKNTWGV